MSLRYIVSSADQSLSHQEIINLIRSIESVDCCIRDQIEGLRMVLVTASEDAVEQLQAKGLVVVIDDQSFDLC